MTPETALERIVHCLDRDGEGGFRSAAFARALDVVRRTPADELDERAARGTLSGLEGIGPSSAAVIAAASEGRMPSYLVELEARTRVPITSAGERYRDALRGDCHMHSTWSDGSAPVAAMAAAAMELGHEYVVQTDHSARLTVAHGLDGDRLRSQLDEIAALNERLAAEGRAFRVLCGMEVDIFPDGTLDLDDEMLERLDVVVASVHSKLRMGHDEMTERMVRAVTSPHVDVLGHCTGRMVDKRPPSAFDPDVVFAACAEHGTAVEINCRPERLDPPAELLAVAAEHGCWFAIDSDAHATGQLEWQPLGCDRAAEVDLPLDRVLNTLSADALLAWCE